MSYGKLRKLDIRLLQLFIIFSPFAFGLFFEYAAYIAQIFLLIIFLLKIFKEKRIKFYLNYSSLMLIVFSVGYLFTCLYAIDRGMAFLGFLKFTIPLTFACLIMQYSRTHAKMLLQGIPIAGILMVILALICKYIPFLPNLFYLPNGRMGGMFQYSNTFALFLLIGIIVLSYSKQNTKKIIIFSAILLLGILLSRSRAVLILTFLNFIFLILKFKDLRKYLIGIIVIAITGGLIVAIKADLISSLASSSTILGRILYYKDALLIILKHPFGLGYMGYSYVYPQIQTGVYQTVFIHNEFLQIALDIGIIPLIAFIVVIFKNIFDNKKFNMFKQILLTIILHIFGDFDLQFVYIFLIFVLSLNLWQGKKYQINANKVISSVAIVAIIGLYLYFGIVSFLNYIDQDELAIKMYPYYTDANIDLIDKNIADNVEEANKIATKILETNQNVQKAYYGKAMYYLKNQNWRLMTENIQKDLEFSKYDMEKYNEYVLMLSGAIDYYASNNDMEEAMKYVKLVTEVPQKIEQVKSSTNEIAYKICDAPTFELNDEVQKYINTMKGVLEND